TIHVPSPCWLSSRVYDRTPFRQAKAARIGHAKTPRHQVVPQLRLEDARGVGFVVIGTALRHPERLVLHDTMVVVMRTRPGERPQRIEGSLFLDLRDREGVSRRAPSHARTSRLGENRSMPYDEILFEVADRIATVTLNRPTKLNAWTMKMEQEVQAALTQAEHDDSVRVIILTGAGRGFCAGADMQNLD